MFDSVGETTLHGVLQERVRLYGERTFLVYEDADGTVTEHTYAEFDAKVARCARGLADRGVVKGDRVVVHLANCPEFLISWYALSTLGAVLVPSNIANTGPELRHIFDTSGARLTITELRFLPFVDDGVRRSGGHAEVVVARGAPDGRTAFEELLSNDAPPPATEVRSDDLAELIFTSGTTRKPKAVMLTHANCVRAGIDGVHCCWLDEGERTLTALPMFHVNAQAMALLSTIQVAGTLVLIGEFRATKFWSQVRRHEATYTSIVAMHLRTVLAQPVAEGERDHRVRRLFYAINVTDGEKEAFEERFGVTLINGYGLSEAMVLLTCAPVVGDRRWPSIGRAAPGRRVLLLDEDGNEVSTGTVGEIAVSGVPGRDIMVGYFGDEESTRETLRDGVLRTGDNAYADEAGFLYFFDRKKDVIKRAGENISALEVEGCLVECEGVVEAAVVGVADDIRDEAVAAFVVTEDPARADAESVLAHCREHLAKFKVPTILEFVDELPKTSIGKVRKDELRRRLVPAAPTGVAADQAPGGRDA